VDPFGFRVWSHIEELREEPWRGIPISVNVISDSLHCACQHHHPVANASPRRRPPLFGAMAGRVVR